MYHNRAMLRFIALVTAVLMVAAACGSDGGDETAIDDTSVDDTAVADDEEPVDEEPVDEEPVDVPVEDGTPPTVGDHWHAPYGVYLCDGTTAQFTPSFPQADNPAGVYSLGDGIIHIQPFDGAGAGGNATLGLFFEALGFTLTDDGIDIGTELVAEGFDCNGEPTVVQVAKWNLDALDADPEVFTENLADIHFDRDLEVYAIAYVAEGDEIPQPPSIGELANLTDIPAEDIPALPDGFTVGSADPPAAGAAITGETPCPGDDAERTTSFEQAPPDCLTPGTSYEAVITTSEGVVRVALDTDALPTTSNNFIVLARYGYYDGTSLFRTDPSIDIIQGGSPTTNSPGDPGPGYTILDEGDFVEGDTGLTGPYTYVPGDLVMARSQGPNASGAQFFFSAGPNTALLDSQGTYLNFGDVVEGLDVLETILGLHVDDPTSGLGGGPSRAVVIESVEIIES